MAQRWQRFSASRSRTQQEQLPNGPLKARSAALAGDASPRLEPSMNTLPGTSDAAHHFAIVPTDVLTDRTLSAHARVLYAVLDGRTCGRAGRLKMATLAADLGLSLPQINRLLAELVRAGYVVTLRTGRSNLYRVINPARESRSIKPERSDLSKMMDLQINRERSITTSAAELDQRSSQPALAPDDGAELDTNKPPRPALRDLEPWHRAAERAGWPVRPHRSVLKALAEIRAQQVKPEALGALIAAYRAIHGANVRNPGGWMNAMLQAIAEGHRPQQLQIPLAPVLYTDHPLAAEPCQHGEPRGSRACAICRHAAIAA